MTLDQHIDSREKAIRANFRTRHSIGIVASARQMEFYRSQKRTTIRRYISELRAAKDPLTANEVEKAIYFRVA
jgi:hypothetical protein